MRGGESIPRTGETTALQLTDGTAAQRRQFPRAIDRRITCLCFTSSSPARITGPRSAASDHLVRCPRDPLHLIAIGPAKSSAPGHAPMHSPGVATSGLIDPGETLEMRSGLTTHVRKRDPRQRARAARRMLALSVAPRTYGAMFPHHAGPRFSRWVHRKQGRGLPDGRLHAPEPSENRWVPQGAQSTVQGAQSTVQRPPTRRFPGAFGTSRGAAGERTALPSVHQSRDGPVRSKRVRELLSTRHGRMIPFSRPDVRCWRESRFSRRLCNASEGIALTPPADAVAHQMDLAE